jgi:subtilisin
VIVDSGVDAEHPFVGGALERAVTAQADEEGDVAIVDDDQGDVSGHGTACAGIIHRVAPQARLTSVRVLGAEITGAGDALLGGLRWAIDERYPIINLSLSTSKSRFVAALHDLADRAYFASCLLIASAHNMPVSSYPWRFSSVLSVASHAGTDPLEYFYNPDPPVEFHAPGVDLEVAWSAGSVIRASGNSFATPNMAGLAARVLGRHAGLTPFQVKTVLHLAATNVGGRR